MPIPDRQKRSDGIAGHGPKARLSRMETIGNQRFPWARVPWHPRCFAEGVNIGMYQAAAALSANARWQEVISENLSAASVPGFKRTELAFSAFEAGLIDRKSVE